MEIVLTDTQVDVRAMSRVVMALSGGMDSTALLLRMLAEGNTVTCISYDYGQKHAIELEMASANIAYLHSEGHAVNHVHADLSSVMTMFDSSLTDPACEVPEGHYEEEQMKQTVVPNRNAIFTSVIYGYALSVSSREDVDVTISLGVHSGDHAIYPDCRPEFYDALMLAFDVGNWGSERVTADLPYVDCDKAAILRDAVASCDALGLDFDVVLGNTNTSYSPDEMGRSSGRTGADVERILAFHAIGRKDPVEYVDGWDVVLCNAIKTQKEYESAR